MLNGSPVYSMRAGIVYVLFTVGAGSSASDIECAQLILSE
jgi:hypothetical protein